MEVVIVDYGADVGAINTRIEQLLCVNDGMVIILIIGVTAADDDGILLFNTLTDCC